MVKTLIILGAGGFAREVLYHLKDIYSVYNGEICFMDDVTNIQEIEGHKVFKKWEDLPKDASFLIGIGSPQAKRIMVAKALAQGLTPCPTVIHPRALVQNVSKLGVGGIITPGVVVTVNVSIGDYVILNLNTTVGHDTVIEDYCTINPGCAISGFTHLCEGVSLGAGTVTREKSKVAKDIVVGAQAAVIQDLLEPGTIAVGIPAKKR